MRSPSRVEARVHFLAAIATRRHGDHKGGRFGGADLLAQLRRRIFQIKTPMTPQMPIRIHSSGTAP